MIQINELSKTYGRQQVLDSLNIRFQKGECIGLIGPNGSGKTTLIKTIMGLVFPDSGAVQVNNIDIKDNSGYRSQIGYMPQMSRLPEHMKVKQLFNMMKSFRKDVSPGKYDEELYHQFNIGAMEHKALGNLSGGMRQKVSAALAFLFNPDILILDEPTASLDPEANEYLKAKIRQVKDNGKLVLITSHILNDLDDLINRVMYMMEGKILFSDTLVQLSKETGESRLNKMIIQKLKMQGQAWES